MNVDIETVLRAGERTLRVNAVPAPSLRVPVNANNRAYLRWLRAVELSAWEAGQPCRPESAVPGFGRSE